MKILVLSDTHENHPLAAQVIDMATLIDAVIHLGDCCTDADLFSHELEVPLIRVAGNCDFISNVPREYVWECEGKRLLLLHGDHFGVKSGLGRLEKHAAEIGVDAVLFGHTHHATVTTLSGILFVNPGTLMKSSPNKSYATLDITPSTITANLHFIP